MNRNLLHAELQERRSQNEALWVNLELIDFLAKTIRDEMQKGNWSGRALAGVVGVEEITIRRLRKGQQNVSIEILSKLCLALDIKLSDIFKKMDF